MTTTVEAIYEQGMLRLKEPIALAEGTEVDVIVISRETSARGVRPSEILAAIAAQPLESDSEFSGRDHDRIFYDGENVR